MHERQRNTSCTFFGHHDSPDYVRSRIKETVKGLIESEQVKTFYVGNQGRFDSMALSVLRELKLDYPQISIYIVLAYMPKPGSTEDDGVETLLPEGIELVPPRYAISKRNRWLIDHVDYVITYVTHSWGGAAQFAALAERKSKKVISLAKD